MTVRAARKSVIIELFEFIEQHEPLSIEVNELWLPNFLLKGDFSRGAVFRLGSVLFNMAFAFASNKITQKYFIYFCENNVELCNFSHTETRSFREFEKNTIKNAKENYSINEEKALKWEK